MVKRFFDENFGNSAFEGKQEEKTDVSSTTSVAEGQLEGGSKWL